VISLRRVWWTVGLLTAAACSDVRVSESVRTGDELVAQKRYGEAVEAYHRARTANPDDKELSAKLGQAYLLSDDAVRAADLLPNDASVQVQAAAQESRQWRFDDAARRMAELLRKEPDHVLALIQHANATARLWDLGGALFVLADHMDRPDRFEAALARLRTGSLKELDVKAEAEFRRALGLAPELPEAQVALANFLWATGRLDEAEALLRAFADQHSGHAAANHALGAFYLARNREDEALTYLRNAASVPGEVGRGARFALIDHYLESGRDAEARQLLGTMGDDDGAGEVSVRTAAIDARAGKPADAVRRIDDVLARIPGQASALLVKAQVLFSMGNPDLRYARAAVSADPQSGEAHALVGAALFASGEYEGALAAYRDAARLDPTSFPAILGLAEVQLELGLVREATSQAQEAVRLGPASKDAALLLVRALAGQQDYAGAERALLALRARFPDDPDVETLAGRLQAARGDSAAARATFLRVLQRAPDSVDALAGLASIELDTGLTPDTRARIEEAVAQRPRDPRVLLVAGRMYLAENDVARAEAVLRRAFTLDPASVEVGQALVEVLKRTRRLDEAADVLARMFERRPRALELRTSRAVLLEQAGKLQEARSLYERIVEEDPDARDVTYRLGALYLSDKSTWLRAEDLARSARKRWPDDAAINALLGRTHVLRGFSRDAVPFLRRAVASDPQNAAYRYELGAAHERVGDLAEAHAEYKRALELDPTLAEAAQARAFLAGRR
jgi:tetratricopeptide (TPR) repeat protein